MRNQERQREFVELRSDQEADDLIIDDEEARDSLRLLA